jgi:hypothetical protein
MTPEMTTLLESIVAAPFECAQDAWLAVMEALELPVSHQPALAKALKESRWRAAKNVRKYLRTVTFRQAERMGLGTVPGPSPLSGELRPRQSYHDALENVTRHDYAVPRDWEDSIYGRLDTQLYENREDASADEDHELSEDCIINWRKVGGQAGLDKDEIAVLEARAHGVTREEILYGAVDDEHRLRLQAAYRRVNDKMPDIQKVLAGKYSGGKPPRNREKQVRKE